MPDNKGKENQERSAAAGRVCQLQKKSSKRCCSDEFPGRLADVARCVSSSLLRMADLAWRYVRMQPARHVVRASATKRLFPRCKTDHISPEHRPGRTRQRPE
eukprot:TRINITY_DN80086_c0_g1_i1.p2 TRINITY_DN80086_c0_g1~~TRINITY_DN80086_c0_g1_i1.p2  ORF type:complete len:102 (+),score=20.69 TRINITY_DN80086_c0_g1_i1:56-361(+)